MLQGVVAAGDEKVREVKSGRLAMVKVPIQRLIERRYLYHGGYEFSPPPGTNLEALRVGNNPEEACA